MMPSKSTSPFSPWSGADASASAADAPSAASSSSGGEALERAAQELSQAAALLQDLARQNGSPGAAGSNPLSLEITVNDALGDAVPFSTGTTGPDLSLLS